MIRLAINIGISLLGSALGLLACAWILDDVSISLQGFILAVVVFTAAESFLAPWVLKVARQHARGLLGVIGLVSTLLALVIASAFPGGIRISGITTWVLASLIVWAVGSLGVWLLPLVLLKKQATTESQ